MTNSIWFYLGIPAASILPWLWIKFRDRNRWERDRNEDER
jgi:hypothetical protein